MLPALLGLLSPIIGKVLDKIPDSGEREKARLEYELKIREQETELLKLFTQVDVGQIEINKEEAKSSSLFVSGWRPAVGWCCTVGIAWAFILKPIADWIVVVTKAGVTTPVLQTGDLMSLLLGLLGMGALRSFEKVKGVAQK